MSEKIFVIGKGMGTGYATDEYQTLNIALGHAISIVHAYEKNGLFMPFTEIHVVKYKGSGYLKREGDRIDFKRPPNAYWTPNGWKKEPYNWKEHAYDVLDYAKEVFTI